MLKKSYLVGTAKTLDLGKLNTSQAKISEIEPKADGAFSHTFEAVGARCISSS